MPDNCWYSSHAWKRIRFAWIWSNENVVKDFQVLSCRLGNVCTLKSMKRFINNDYRSKAKRSHTHTHTPRWQILCVCFVIVASRSSLGFIKNRNATNGSLIRKYCKKFAAKGENHKSNIYLISPRRSFLLLLLLLLLHFCVCLFPLFG